MDIDGDVQRGKGGSAVQREDPLSVPPCPLGCDFRISHLWPGGVQARPLDAEPSKESAGGQGHNHPSQRGEPRVQALAASAIIHPDTVHARRESSRGPRLLPAGLPACTQRGEPSSKRLEMKAWEKTLSAREIKDFKEGAATRLGTGQRERWLPGPGFPV